jgi:SAM-dependent methyltransferase
MKVFDAYAAYYDLLYRDKDYARETAYVLGLLTEHGVRGGELLELGCGTGRHAGHFAEAGFRIHGVDLSAPMVEKAAERFAGVPVGHRFEVGDVRTLRLERSFDAVVSLFHVFSYQSTNDDLDRAFCTASHHLRPGGAFVFDFWYGPGVLSDPPVVRVKEMADETVELLRIAEPLFLPNANCVDVRYRVLLTELSTRAVHRIEETHRMRYLFMPELERLSAANGLRITAAYSGQTLDALGFGAWTGTVVAVKS